ncbi:hypothetical protein WICPIJ_000676 [Wickerhamomyces pijperi]|uniref:Uncharacterized protein n=1 Tax=Wickerhamomyces pijperi TaxID=599730 RepID=A0A9P8TQM3_WICPI|nr:hypothetical protein WICPIJ_000676 [Wickerhamomyces pijperi]
MVITFNELQAFPKIRVISNDEIRNVPVGFGIIVQSISTTISTNFQVITRPQFREVRDIDLLIQYQERCVIDVGLGRIEDLWKVKFMKIDCVLLRVECGHVQRLWVFCDLCHDLVTVVWDGVKEYIIERSDPLT